jgi:hypothetical protein
MNHVFETTAPSIKNFLVKHKTALTVVATATLCLAVNRIAMSQHDQFLKDNDLYDEFYNSEI